MIIAEIHMNRLIMIDGHFSAIIISCGLLFGWDSGLLQQGVSFIALKVSM